MVDFYPRPPRGGRLPCHRWRFRGSPISIHALREEGDSGCAHGLPLCKNFYPRPPRGGRPSPALRWGRRGAISIHALREEGDHDGHAGKLCRSNFYPRPPRGGRHNRHLTLRHSFSISIHALREEGDAAGKQEDGVVAHISIHALREEGDTCSAALTTRASYFYPRPPRGGRLGLLLDGFGALKFLSTPSARRATSRASCSCGVLSVFLSTPSARRATDFCPAEQPPGGISIHALREEGDQDGGDYLLTGKLFLSTPSARRATRIANILGKPELYFYPRPPRGGRPGYPAFRPDAGGFLSTPSARRATDRADDTVCRHKFLSTPSARRATSPFFSTM